ncbi:hypothetical protein V1264_007028 [Littorina saxatilis]|uniref:Carbonic anhydrase n=1 Tax=Littorina saxatilis TaxID=31220 RepID=A0AAN9ATZ9_9CAEN
MVSVTFLAAVLLLNSSSQGLSDLITKDDNSAERGRRQGVGYPEMVCGPLGPNEHFSYNPVASDGVDKWWWQWKCCGGKLQSPIALDRRAARCLTASTPLYTGPPLLLAKLYNTGHDVQVTVVQAVSPVQLRNVGQTDLWSRYTLDNVHIHFGNQYSRGSEHVIDGQAFQAEMHLVHYNDKYGSLEQAMVHRDGLAVIAVTVSTERGDLNTHWADLLLAISTLRGSGESSAVPFQLMPDRLLPVRRDLFYYRGSLTTPSCSETVQFMVMEHPLLISAAMLQMLWSLPSDVPGVPISRNTNIRPLQPDNGRTVNTNFFC